MAAVSDVADIDAGNEVGELSCLRAEGKRVNLTARYEAHGAAGQCGIGHMRWATHGKPEERNAPPWMDRVWCFAATPTRR